MAITLYCWVTAPTIGSVDTIVLYKDYLSIKQIIFHEMPYANGRTDKVIHINS